MDRPLVRFDRPVMGGVLGVTLAGRRRECAGLAGAVFREVERLEGTISRFETGSALSRLNRCAAAGCPVAVEPVLRDLLAAALHEARRTNGAFDVTVEPLMRLWGFRTDRPVCRPPSREQIEAALRIVGSRHVRLDGRDGTVAFGRRGVEIDFGAIGKGFAVDRAVQVLRRRGVSSALVSFGSVAFALGSPPGRDGWSLAVQDPRRPDGILGSLRLHDRAVSSSGDYRQRRRVGAAVVPHVIDPRTGRPTEAAAGATVVCGSATTADALSTALLVLGADRGLRLAADDPDLEGLILSVRGGGRLECRATGGWTMAPSARPGMTRRRFVKAALVALGTLALTGRPALSSIEERAERAVRLFFPDAEGIRRERVRLDPAQMKAAWAALGRGFREDAYVFLTAAAGGLALGRAVILDVRGRERPITFLVAVDPGGVVSGVEVLAYREAIGGEIRSRRFLGQFRGRTIADRLRPGEEFHGITGATLSSRATGYAVRKGLALIGAVHGTSDGGGDE